MAGLVGSVDAATQQAACGDTNVDVVRFLSQLRGYRHENPAARDNSAIRWAARHGRCDVVQYLCELPVGRGVNPGAGDNGAIQWAARNGHVDVVRYLCELPGDRGVNPGARDNSAIGWAAQYGHVDVVRYLCELPPPHSKHLVQCACQAIHAPGATAQYLYHAHTLAVMHKWKHQTRLGKYHTLFARMSARRPMLVVYALVRGFRCGSLESDSEVYQG